jgi:hypothetical protein
MNKQTEKTLWMDCNLRLLAGKPCAIADNLEDLFLWMDTEDGEQVMPHLGLEATRVNFCPVCAAKIRHLTIEKP